MANPAERTWVGNIAVNVADMVPSCIMKSSPRMAYPAMAKPMFLPINQNNGIATMPMPISDMYQFVLRPKRSDSRPEIGINATMATSPRSEERRGGQDSRTSGAAEA